MPRSTIDAMTEHLQGAQSDDAPEAAIVHADDSTGLIDALDVVDDQPLEQRATAFAALHDRLRAELDGVAGH